MIDSIALFLLVLARVSVFIAFFPLFSKKQLPAQVKAGMATALSLFWLSDAKHVLPEVPITDFGSVMFVLLVFKELTVGLLLSIILGLFFWPGRVAGAYVAQELGLSMASISDPSSQDSSTLVARVFEAFGVLIFFSLNLHHFIILTIHVSFQHALTKVGWSKLPFEEFVFSINRITDYGLLLAAPLMVLLMIVTLVLAFLNRAAPALNLFSVGMTMRVGLGAVLLFLFCPILLGAMEIYFYRIQDDIENLMLAITG